MRVRAMALGTLLAVGSIAASSQARADPDPASELRPGEDTLETYELSLLCVIHHGPGDRGWRACRGKYRERLATSRFFELAGRPDLARETRRKGRAMSALFYGGFGALFAGVAVGMIGVVSEERPLVFVGGGVAAGGVGLLALRRLWPGVKVSGDEAERMADEYNGALRTRLALPDEGGASSRSGSASPLQPASLAPPLLFGYRARF